MRFLTRTITFPEKEFREQVAEADQLVTELRATLAEALEWIERPVASVDDVVYFELFEERAKRLVSE